MLDKIAYLGHEIVQSSFSSQRKLQGKTYYRHHINLPDEFSFVEIFNPDQVHLHNEISMVLNAYVEGIQPNLKTSVFTLEIQFLIRFELDKTLFIEKQDVTDHLDFFMQFANLAAHTIIDSILAYNAINCTVLPAHLQQNPLLSK